MPELAWTLTLKEGAPVASETVMLQFGKSAQLSMIHPASASTSTPIDASKTETVQSGLVLWLANHKPPDDSLTGKSRRNQPVNLTLTQACISPTWQ